MAYVHHVLVWRAFGGYEHSRGKYLLLGDDIVIFDRRAYTNYCKLLETLGIPYTNNFSKVGFEFAKRTFCNGVEITGAYSSALWASRNSPELFSMEWRTLASRGYKSGNDLPPLFRQLLKVNRKRFEKCKLLMLIPYGTNPSVVDMAKFVNHVTGRSNCFLQVGKQDNSVKAIESFRQGASLLIKQSFQKLLDDAKNALDVNAKSFTAYFTDSYYKILKVTKPSELDDQQVQVMQKAINEYISDGTTRIRFLERDLKQSYLGSTQISTSQTGEEEMLHIPPSNKVLLRPSLPQIPRFINFSERDSHMVKLKFRAEHQLNIVSLLRG
jgi:hypothetical protein